MKRLPCKQCQAGALPAGLHHFKFSAGNSTNAQRAASYAVTGGCDSHSRYQFREMIRPPDCKSGVTKQGRKRRLARYQHFPPFWIRSSISGATRCLREGWGCKSLRIRQFLSACSVVANAPGLGPGDRRCKSCHADQFCRAAVVEHIGIRLLIGTMQVGILPAAPIARWCQSSTTVC